MGFSRINSDC